ncbi:unnamed protein product [Rotaria sp. Silwood1]|nr:unnamed protein product [Rotaria sp. Silwood1]
MSWLNNLDRTGSGFWSNSQWYDLHLSRRMPLVNKMIEEMVYACPPSLSPANIYRVADLCCGSGMASLYYLKAYPIVSSLTLIDQSEERLNMAKKRIDTQLESISRRPEIVMCKLQVKCDSQDNVNLKLNGSSNLHPYHLILASLALHVIVGHEKRSLEESKLRYRILFELLFRNLVDDGNGHLIVGDHSGSLGMFEQMKLMEECGFVDVECVWRERDMFVIGGRRRGKDEVS